MLREVALRRALQDGRDRRQRELEEIQERGRALRRRLRELTDQSFAIGSVHGRLFPEKPGAEPSPLPAAPVERVEAVVAPAPSPSVAPASAVPAPIVPVVARAPATVRREEPQDRLLDVLVNRHPDGFTVGQMREALDEIDTARTHSYDAAWTLANNLVRSRALEVAGARPGSAGPVRVLRVSGRPAPSPAPTPTEAR